MKAIKIFIISCLLGTFCTYSQTYKSVLGNDTVRWNIFRQVFDASWTEAYFSYSDTLIEQQNYKFLYKNIIMSATENIFADSKILVGILREDTINGKLWIKLNDSGNFTKEYTLMDLTLKKGDSADVFVNWRGTDYERFKVDLVYFENNLKIITFVNSDLKYIESVGSTRGFEGLYDAYSLLCKYNNDNLVFSNGQCFYDFSANIDNVKYDPFKIKIVSDKLDILFENEAKRILSLYDVFGRCIFNKQISSSSVIIPFINKHKGVYILKLENNSNRVSQSIKLVI